MRSGDRWRAGGDLRAAMLNIAVGAAWFIAAVIAVRHAAGYIIGGTVGFDAHTYWEAARAANPYTAGLDIGIPYLYPPLFAELLRPLAGLGWPAFAAILMSVEGACYYWLLRPLPVRWRVPALLACVPMLAIGNVEPVLDVALVFSLSRPALWAAPALTKITPAGVGLVWFAARGDWRAILRTAVVTATLAAASFAFEPQLWVAWVAFMHTRSSLGVEAVARILVAFAVTLYASRTDRPWLVGITAALALPLFSFTSIGRLASIAPVVRLSCGSPLGHRRHGHLDLHREDGGPAGQSQTALR